MIKRLSAIILSLLIALTLASCRFSDVLAQIIYDQYRNGMLDIEPPFDIAQNQPENEETSDDLKDLLENEEALRTTEQDEELPIYGEDETEETSEPAPSGVQQEVVPTSVPEAAETAESEIVGDAGEDSGGSGDDGTGSEADAVVITSKQVVDAYGSMVEIPENVATVAATDDLAVMVLMLGGDGRLKATNEGLNSGLLKKIYPQIENTETLWSGSGADALSPDKFERLLELKPEVVLEVSGSATFTNAQVETLKANDIAYLVLPSLTNATNINTVITTLGTVLGDKSEEGGTNAPAIASEYVSWVNTQLSRVNSATKDYESRTDGESGITISPTYTLYIDDWDESAAYRLYHEPYTTLEGIGAAVVRSGDTAQCKAVSSFLSYAQITNTASLYGIGKKIQYFTPLVSAFREMEVLGSLAEGMIPAGQKLLEQGAICLGTDNFKFIVVPSETALEAIRGSELWQVYPHIDSGDGTFNSDGFLDEEGNLVRTQISGEYEIAVNPYGATSWVDGGVESILESVWAAYSFFGTIEEQSVRDTISEFYAKFYHYELSESELDDILNGI